MIQLGLKGKDKVTNFEGIITGRCTYLYGCDQYCLTPEVDKEGKRVEAQWFDEGRIEITGNGIVPEEVQVEEPGGEGHDHPSEASNIP